MSFSSPDPRRDRRPERRGRWRVGLAGVVLGFCAVPAPGSAQTRDDAGAVRERARPAAFEEEGAADEEVTPRGRRLGAQEAAGRGRGGGAGTAPAWIPYATAAAYLAHERSAERGLAVDANGTTVSEVQGAEAQTAGVGGEVGLRFTGERTTARLAYMLGLALRDDEEAGWQSVTHGLQAEAERQATQRLALRAAAGTFVGLRESQTALDGVGLGGGTAPPGTDRRLLARIPYLRQDAALGLTAATGETVRHRFGVAGSALLYPDREVVEAAGERLFETWTVGPEYGLEWGVTERDTLQLGANAATTWFVPVFSGTLAAEAGEGAPSSDTVESPAPLQTVGAQVGLTRRLSTTWTVRAHVGAGIVWPLEDARPQDSTSEALDTGASAALLAGVGTQWRRGRWQLSLEGGRETTQSEVGAVFATSTARGEGRRRLTESVDVAVRGGVARYDVLAQVFASEADLAAFAAAPPGVTDRETLVERARRAQEGYGLEAGALGNWRLSPVAALSITYSMEQRISDDRDRGDRLVHRGILGLTVATMIGGQSALPVGGDEE